MARKSRYNNIEKETWIDEVINSCYKVGLYTRLSVEDGDEEEFNSIGNQRKIAEDFLLDRSDLSLEKVYKDNGYTGMNYNRPGFIEMMDDIKKGIINCIVVKDVSRLGRHFLQTSELVEKTLPSLNVRLICINDDYDSAAEYADSGTLLLPIQMIMNDYYVKDTSQKIRSSISAKMENGEYLPSASSIPYGYLRDPDNTTFKIDEEVAPVIKQIYQWRLEGISFTEIVRRLNTNNVPSPGKIRYDRGITNNEKYKDTLWCRSTIRKILNDPVYTGTKVHGKIQSEKLGAKKVKMEQSEWLMFKNAHPSIISEETFDAVKAINEGELEKRKSFKKRADVGFDTRDIFKGKLFCGECGSKMLGGKGCARENAKTPSRVFFECGNYRDSNHIRCSSHYIRQEEVMRVVKNALKIQFKLALDVEKLIERLENNNTYKTYRESVVLQRRSNSMKISNLEDKLEQALMDYSQRLLTKDEYLHIKEKYSNEIKELSEMNELLYERILSMDETLENTVKWIAALKKDKEIKELNKDIIDVLIDRIEIYSNKKIHIKFNYDDLFEPIFEISNKIGVELNVAG